MKRILAALLFLTIAVTGHAFDFEKVSFDHAEQWQRNPGGFLTWINMPAALTEWPGATIMRVRHPADLSQAIEARIYVWVHQPSAVLGAEFRGQYSLDGGMTWAYLDGAVGPSVNVNMAGLRVSGWVPIEPAALTDVVLRVVGLGGNGVDDPKFGLCVLEIKSVQ